MKLLVISGRSGSGKSITLRYLEDLGFYCVDNLPLDFFPDLYANVKESYTNIAVSIDGRTHAKDLSRFRDMLKQAKSQGQTWEVIYFDADDNILVRRYSETRRKHPLTTQTIDLKEAIQRESTLLNPIADCADLLIDTTSLSPAQLGELLHTRVIQRSSHALSILFTSFGFKHGIPADLDTAVAHYLAAQPRVQNLLGDIVGFLDKWIPCFQADNRSYLTIAIGCTGGQHRSVYLVEELGRAYKHQYSHVQIRHRELK